MMELKYSKNQNILGLTPLQYERILYPYSKLTKRNTFTVKLGLPLWYLDEVRNMHEFLVEDLSLSDSSEVKCLAILICELADLDAPRKRNLDNVLILKPRMSKGAREMVEVLNLFEQNVFNIEAIHFDVRRNVLAGDLSQLTQEELKGTKNTVRKSIPGVELIGIVLRSIRQQRECIEKLAIQLEKSEEVRKKIPVKISGRRAASAKRIAKVIYDYLIRVVKFEESKSIRTIADILKAIKYLPESKLTDSPASISKKQYDLTRKYIKSKQ